MTNNSIKRDSNTAALDKSSFRESDSFESRPLLAPAISLPKGDSAVRGISEKFTANPVTGTGSLSIPSFTSSGRSGFGPQLTLSFDSGAGYGFWLDNWC